MSALDVCHRPVGAAVHRAACLNSVQKVRSIEKKMLVLFFFTLLMRMISDKATTIVAGSSFCHPPLSPDRMLIGPVKIAPAEKKFRLEVFKLDLPEHKFESL